VALMNRRVLSSTLLFVLVFGLLCLAGCGNRPGEIRGKVTAAPSGQAVAQAHMIVYDLTVPEGDMPVNVFVKGAVLQDVVTDANGSYSISLAPGTFIIQVWANEQQVADRLVKVGAGRVVTVDFEVDLPSP
jgi:hypothetical protein